MMKKSCLLIICLVSVLSSFGQDIISPDTVCVGVPVSFDLDSSAHFASFAWEFGTSSLTPVLTNSVPIPGTGINGSMFSVVDQATMVIDTSNGIHYYAFITSCDNAISPSVQRLDFGNNPDAAPVVTNLGNPNNAFTNPANSNLEAVEVVLDETGIFHAFFNNRGIVHWVFGNGLDNPPTQATRIFDNTSVLGMGMQMAVKKVNNQWIIFTGQSYGISNIIRFDLGTNLNNIPNPLPYTILPQPSAPAAFQDPSYFSILNEGGQWNMMVAPLIVGNTNLYRYNFGTNLQNNNPTITDLGTFNPAININRGLNFIRSCDSFYMLGLNQDGTVLSFDFQNNINNIPTTQSLGQIYGSNVNMVMLKPYWYNDTLWALSGNWNAASASTANVYRFPLLAIPSGNAEIKYYDPATTHTFTSPGIYNVTLYCDQADPRGPRAFCKQIVVVGHLDNFLGPDTSLCAGNSLTLNAAGSGTNSYQWSTGSTSSSIEVTQSGTYWVNVSGSSCVNGTDSIHVTFNPVPQVTIQPNDTGICQGKSLLLHGSGATHYSWTPTDYLDNPNSPDVLASPPHTITYFLSGKDDTGCEGKDSVKITVHPYPNIEASAESNSVSCFEASVQLHATGAMTYLWQPGIFCDDSTSADPMVTPSSFKTVFYVTGKDAIGCEGTDSITILSVKKPVFFVPSAFSPNGDGLNDLFHPEIYCDLQLTSFSIFNRWGQLIYRDINPGKGWDGTFNHKPADAGTYFWYIEGKAEDGSLIQKSGDVTLIR